MISVVMTAYNVENYLEKAINSVLNQEYSDIELILVNDCSTDNSNDIINSFTDPRIKRINNDINMGAGYSRKIGIENASGEYIITIDSDDWIEPTFLQNLYNNSENYDMVFGGMMFDFENGDSIRFDTQFGIFSGMSKFELMRKKKLIFLNTCLVKRDLYKLVQYDTKRYNEDTPTLAKLLYFSEKIKIVEEFGYHYLQNTQSLCHKSDEFFKHLCLLQTGIDLIEFFKDKPAEYKHIVTINDLYLQMSYLNDINGIVKHQDAFNKAMLGFINRIQRE